MDDFLRFLDLSPTVFHAAKNIEEALTKAHFTLLKEDEKWRLELGKGYLICRDGALVAAFRLPQKNPLSATLLASHLDSPCLKIKPQPELFQRGIGQLGTECYGSPILHSWLDRDLLLAGKIRGLDTKGKRVSHLVSLTESPFIIPQLALHLDRSSSEKGFIVNKQDHLKAVFSLQGKEGDFVSILKKNYPFDQLVSFDLFLVPAQKSSLVGAGQEIIASHRLDNLSSAYASLFALLHTSSSEDVLQMAFFWDHEEIGSMSHLGADSLFAGQLLERISLHLNMEKEDLFRLKSRSICLSIDAAHGFHPNFAEKYDPQNSPLLGKGVALKFNANQRYATSSKSASPIFQLAKKHHIPLQLAAFRSDIPSGSTVGSMMASHLGIPTVDLGVPTWAMHSARETISTEDEISLCSLLKASLEEPMREEG